MTNTNPATPAPAATPGSTPNVITTPSTTTPTVVPEGKVTISTKEFAQLQRDAARGKSAQRRSALNSSKAPVVPVDGSDPTAVAIAEANQRAEAAERAALAFQVKAGINNILAKPEFKNLPASTKELIRSNPAMLSDADNVEEALLDIEDKVREFSSLDDITPSSIATPPAPKSADPVGHETPPAPGTPPAPVQGIELEDPSKLPPEQRSRAVLRNAIKKRNGIK